jgi:hypothetical protein
MIQAFKNRSGVEVGTEDVDRFVARKGLRGMIPRRHPEIPRKLFWVREFTFRKKGIFAR